MTRWSESDLEEIPDERIHDQTARSSEEESSRSEGEVVATAQEAEPAFRSKTERRWARLLSACDQVQWWGYEPMSRRIGPKRHYRPDFEVIRADGGIEYHEIKGGHVWDRALVKPSAAASIYPFFDWLVIQQEKKGALWTVEWREPSRAEMPRTTADVIVSQLEQIEG